MTTKDSQLGQSKPILPTQLHFIYQIPLTEKIPEHARTVLLGMGCYWGAERLLWQQTGVINTAVGFSGGFTVNPTYKEVCTGNTDHAEVVRVVFDSQQTSLEALLAKFWEHHDPTQGMRQGNDIGTQYRSVIFVENEHDLTVAQKSKTAYQQALQAQGIDAQITTEIALIDRFYFAEDDHQQYLAKNPQGYCGLGGMGVCYPADKS